MVSKSSGKILKIGILGGSFDPIHLGHIGLARDALICANLDKVVFIPAKLQPFKLGKKMTGGEDRLNMLKMALMNYEGFEISTYELDSENISYTYLTLRALKEMYGNYARLYFITGTDAFLKIDKWKNSDELLTGYSFIVGTRPGYRDEELNSFIKNIESNYGTEIIKINNEEIDVSSTEIRNAIFNGDSLRDYIPEEVERYIIQNGLYK